MSRYRGPVTPAELHAVLRSLTDELAPGGTPLYVDVNPINAPVNECFPIVEAIVADQGGEIVTGWSLWEVPSVFVEAEFHAVWRMPDGNLVDPTPKNRPTQRVYFLVDPVRRYSGKQVNNVRRAVSTDPRVRAFLDTFDAQFELMNKGALADMHGLVELDDEDAARLRRIFDEREELGIEIQALYPRIGPYLPCSCGSGKKMRWCHRE